MLTIRRTSPRRQSRGLSMVEMMIGIVVGMFVVAAAIYFVVNFNSENRRLLLESRLTQDMRAAMDVVTRELRRAGYWTNAQQGTAIYGANPTLVPYDGTGYATMSPAPGASAASAAYAYARAASNTVNPATEQFSFARSGNILTATIGGGGAQPLTDPATMVVDDFTVVASESAEDVVCPITCTVNCPRTHIREFAVTLTAHAVHDPSVRRTLTSNVRVRNDRQTGVCPT